MGTRIPCGRKPRRVSMRARRGPLTCRFATRDSTYTPRVTWGDAGTAITAMGMSGGATVAFRVGGDLRVAVIVKATFILAPDGPMLLVDPDPIVRADQLRDKSPTSSLVAAGDLVPYRPHADVLLQGHARAPGGKPTPAMAVRLMVARGAEVVLDKRLAVRGTPDPTGATREPSPFTAMLLAWELSAGTPENPVGIRETAHAWPHIVDPRHRDRPAGFGPLSPRWPSRRRLLKVPESAFEAAIPALPRDFAWSYFNAAPEDQRVEFFRGDEWVGFEGMSSQLPRVQSCLPGVVGRARVYGPQGPSLTGQPVPLEADTVIIDTDRLRCSVVWRGSFPIAHEKYLRVLEVVAGVETAERPLAFPAAYTGRSVGASSPPPAPAPSAPRPDATEESRTQEMPAARVAPATPFGPASAPARPIRQRPLPAATPFEGAHLTPAPLPGDQAPTADLSGLVQRLAARIPPQSVEQTVDDGELLAHLEGTMPIGAHGSAGSASALPFGRPPSSGPPPIDGGSTVDFTALLAGKALPFTGARAEPTPLAARQAPAAKAFEGGRTMAIPAFFAGDALPFAAPAPPAGEAPPTPIVGATAPAPKPSVGSTMAIDMLLIGTALPFAEASPALPVREAPPLPLPPAPAVVPAYAPIGPAAVTFAPVASTFAPVASTFAPVASIFAPVAPPSPALLRAIEPVAEPPAGDAPQTLGAFFLAAMARAAAGSAGRGPGGVGSRVS
jgi:hypothetical protein